jgi:hypothetical protein
MTSDETILRIFMGPSILPLDTNGPKGAFIPLLRL